MTQEGYNKHKELIEAWGNGALIEYLDTKDGWMFTESPSWYEHTEYRIKPQEPKKKTIVLETWLCKGGDDTYYTVEGTEGWHDMKVKLLSTREVEIDEK